MALTAMLLALIIVGTFAYVTRPNVFRGVVIDALVASGLRSVSVESVQFYPPDEVRVLGLCVLRPPWIEQDLAIATPEFVRAERATVRIDAGQLLSGKTRVRSITLDSPAINLVAQAPRDFADRTADEREWSVMTTDDMLHRLPSFRMNRADVSLYRDVGGSRQLRRRSIVDGNGEFAVAPDGHAEYRATLTQVGGQFVAAPASEQFERGMLARVRWRADGVRIDTGLMEIDALLGFLPDDARTALAPLSLAGWIAADDVHVRDGRCERATIRLKSLTGVAPLESDPSLSAAERFLAGSVSDGTLTWLLDSAGSDNNSTHSASVTLQLSGSLNGASTQLESRLDGLRTLASDPSSDAFRLGSSAWAARDFSGSLRIREFELPTSARHRALLESENLPAGIRDFFADYQPQGPANLDLTWSNRGQSFRGVYEPLGAACRYFRFPYRIDQIHGRVIFTDSGIQLEALHGRHGSGHVWGDGKLDNSHKWTGFDLTFRGENLPLDFELFESLPAEHQHLWQSADLIGLCDLVMTMQRDDGSQLPRPQPTRQSINARLRSGAVRLDEQARVSQADAVLEIVDDSVRIRRLDGRWNDADLSLSGVIGASAHGRNGPRSVLAEANGFAVDRSSALRAREEADLGAVRFAGNASAWAHVTNDERGASLSAYSVRLNSGDLHGFDQALPWTGALGWVSVRNGRERILSLRAKRGDGIIEVRGALPGDDPGDVARDLELVADDRDIDRLLRGLIPLRWADVRTALGLAGAGRVRATFLPATHDGAERQGIDIEVLADRMKPAALPLDLTEVAARISVSAEGAQIHEAQARYSGAPPITLNGMVGWRADDSWARVVCRTPMIELTSTFVSAMPRALGALLQRLAARGKISVQLDPLELVSQLRQDWRLSGRVQMQQASLKLGLPFENIAGEIAGRCDIPADAEPALDADLSIDSGTLDGRPIEKWVARLVRGPGEALLRFDELKGHMCGGSVLGYVHVNPDTLEYELSLNLADLSLTDFLKDSEKKSRPPRPGRLDGRVFLRGRGEDSATRSGGGELRIRGGSLLTSPLTSPLVQARSGRKPVSETLERADLKFVWEGSVLRFSRIDLVSRDLRLVGRGAWDMRDDTIAMTLAGATGEDAPKLAMISDLLESAAQELIQYRVDGTVEHPRVTVEPMHNLTEPLRRLLKGE